MEFVITAKQMVQNHKLDYNDLVDQDLILTPFTVEADSKDAALDAFHNKIPIRALEDWEITAEDVTDYTVEFEFSKTETIWYTASGKLNAQQYADLKAGKYENWEIADLIIEDEMDQEEGEVESMTIDNDSIKMEFSS